MVSKYPMVKNVATRIVFPILDADGDLVGGATNLDSEYSLDGGNFTDCASEATNMTSAAANTGVYYLDLAQGETNGDIVCIQVKSTEGKTTVLVFYTSTQTLDTMDTNLDSLMADVGDASASTLGSLYGILGNPAALAIKTSVEDVHTDVAAVKAETALIVADTNELQTDWVNGGRLDLLIDSIVTSASVAAAYAIVNSGLGFRGTVTNVPGANQFTIATLVGVGAGAFGDATSPWYAYVFRDAGGASGAPQGEFKKVTAYVSATGTFTTEAYTIAVAAGDDMIILNPKISEIGTVGTNVASILADTNELQTDWVNGGRLDLLLDAVKASTDALTLAAIADAIHDEAVEGAYTLRQATRIILSACGGKLSGAGTGTLTFRDVNDTANRIVATVDANNNRTGVALTV